MSVIGQLMRCKPNRKTQSMGKVTISTTAVILAVVMHRVKGQKRQKDLAQQISASHPAPEPNSTIELPNLGNMGTRTAYEY